MLRVRGRVNRGRIVVDEPVDLPDGAEIELEVVEADDEWPAELDAELMRRFDDARQGNVVPLEEAVARLRRR